MTKPLVIFFAESDHGDMSYSSLLKQLIEECENKGLSVKVFSEFESQTQKVETQSWSKNDEEIDGIERQLKNLRNVPQRDVHAATTEFLNSRLIPMGSIRDRWGKTVPKTWDELPEEIQKGTPENLLSYFAGQGTVDNPAILKIMKDDVAQGRIPESDDYKNTTQDSEKYYKYWGNCLNYKMTHEIMAQDVRSNLAHAIPDVIIMIAGNAHIPGLDQQLSEFSGLQKTVIRNKQFDEHCTNPLSQLIYGGSSDIIDGVGEIVGFDIDGAKKAIIPDIVQTRLSEIQSSKAASKTRNEESVVEKLGLQKPDEKPRSFVEAMVEKYEKMKSPEETKKSFVEKSCPQNTNEEPRSFVKEMAEKYEKMKSHNKGSHDL